MKRSVEHAPRPRSFVLRPAAHMPRLGGCLVGLAVALGAGATWAQQPPANGATAAPALPDGQPTEQATKLKEVVVTAQRREESAQKVPTAITVLSGDNLIDTGIGRTAADVLDYVPNA